VNDGSGLPDRAAGTSMTMTDASGELKQELDEAGLTSTVAAGTDVGKLRDGGPQGMSGVMTTTGGTAGPNSFTQRPRSGPGVANPTPGDAGTGSMEPPADS
jgi:hypothetical protein